MIPYEELIRDALLGDTPKVRYEVLMEMKRILQIIAYPRRGTAEENMDIQEIEDLIQSKFSLQNLEAGK